MEGVTGLPREFELMFSPVDAGSNSKKFDITQDPSGGMFDKVAEEPLSPPS